MVFTWQVSGIRYTIVMILRSAICCLLLTGIVIPVTSLASDIAIADRVIISKSERKLFLIKGEEIIRTFDVSLGLLPEGDKSKEGDFRTPEGYYLLTNRNTDSDFFLSIQVSYPNEEDVRKARQKGYDPGGQIMIHGYPNEPRHSLDYYRQTDWTDGCIAVTNADMVDIWLMTTENTPIIIRP